MDLLGNNSPIILKYLHVNRSFISSPEVLFSAKHFAFKVDLLFHDRSYSQASYMCKFRPHFMVCSHVWQEPSIINLLVLCATVACTFLCYWLVAALLRTIRSANVHSK
jgi:hypothetical protein